MAETGEAFGARLRRWRARRGLSQLDLALIADSSQRHLSFLESGRTRPSRDMILRLAAALDMPLAEQNALMVAAGFAPVWRARDLAAPELAAVNAALDSMLAQQEPFPALVVDRRWTLLRANGGAQRLVAFLAGAAAPPPSDAPACLADLVLAPGPIRDATENWREVALYFLRSVQADALADGQPATAALLRRLLDLPGMPRLADLPDDAPDLPVLTIAFRKGDTALRLFTTIATLGTPRDVTLQEIRIEAFFPADEATRACFRHWAAA